jgi:putative two-component system response regulator
MRDTALKWLADFKADRKKDKTLYPKEDKTYLISISDLSDGSHKRGFMLYITDDTKNQQYISLLDSFNADLKAEVAEKTQHIIEMHDQLILGMATMVESRDNSTGGHIRRTSEGVRILTDEIRKGTDFPADDVFYQDLIKAAPMHDLGKIAVDDAVLRKPGRFTPEEFAVMKTHAPEGARIVHEILRGTDDERFRMIAENVAHYHHERWDGSGYPEGLRGEQIPLEARIMAIADVYDALVSKRVYKDSMSFAQADSIITEGMGKHFDPRLQPYYIAARPRLEAYYSKILQTDPNRSAEGTTQS